MVQASGSNAVQGRSIGLWFGRPGADLTVLLTQLQRNGQIRHFHTSIQGEHGLDSEVEVSAVSAAHAEMAAIGIVIRDITRRLGNEANPTDDLNEAVERLADRVGQVSLKQLVEDTVSLVELHFIDAALQLTGDNRSAAAELLGLSRQSLYTKLKRYGLDRPDTASR
jgi:transcriptional regulator PpsR